MTIVPAPLRYPDRPRIMKALMRLRHRVWDRYTGTWLRSDWLAERNQIMDREVEFWETRSSGTCMVCGQEMRLHPPARMWDADPRYCPTRKLTEANDE